jgi:hypothetical protein
MPAKKYIVTLCEQQRQELERIAVSNKRSLRERTRARILLLADTARPEGGRKDTDISNTVRTCTLTVGRVRRRFCQEGQESALKHKEQHNRKRRLLDGEAEAHLIALTCSTPPQGHKRWSLHLLQDRLIEERIVDTVSHETVRQTLKKTNLNPG